MVVVVVEVWLERCEGTGGELILLARPTSTIKMLGCDVIGCMHDTCTMHAHICVCIQVFACIPSDYTNKPVSLPWDLALRTIAHTPHRCDDIMWSHKLGPVIRR